jgi:hypothetical protein
MMIIPFVFILSHLVMGCASTEVKDKVGSSTMFYSAQDDVEAAKSALASVGNLQANNSNGNSDTPSPSTNVEQIPTAVKSGISGSDGLNAFQPNYYPGLDPTRFAGLRPPFPPMPVRAQESPFRILMDFLDVPKEDRTFFTQAVNRWRSVVVSCFDAEKVDSKKREDFKQETGCTHPKWVQGTFICVKYTKETKNDLRPGGIVILGSARAIHKRSGSRTTISGTLRMNSGRVATLKKDDQLIDTITHEIGHILGKRTAFQRSDEHNS